LLRPPLLQLKEKMGSHLGMWMVTAKAKFVFHSMIIFLVMRDFKRDFKWPKECVEESSSD
jgi:hypothetical protein